MVLFVCPSTHLVQLLGLHKRVAVDYNVLRGCWQRKISLVGHPLGCALEMASGVVTTCNKTHI